MTLNSETQGSLALWRAVIAQHLSDATSIGRDGTLSLTTSQARAWLLEPNPGFVETCHLANLEPSRVRTFARRRIAEADELHKQGRKIKQIHKTGHHLRGEDRGVVANFSNEAQHRHSPVAQETT